MIPATNDPSDLRIHLPNGIAGSGVNTGAAVFQFKIVLKHTGSPVWRRVLVPDDWSFAGLHAVIQAAFEWNDRSLHNFTFGRQLRIESENEINELSQPSSGIRIRCENMTEMGEVFSEFERGIYTYDLEENWEHDVIFEKVLPREPNMIYPCCLKARGQAPADGSFELVEPDLSAINIRLAILMPKHRRYLYRNPFEWRLFSCLSKQRLLQLRAMAKYHATAQWHKMDKESLISALPADILDSLDDFVAVDTKRPVPEQLLCFLLANHHSELPFELERYQECFRSETSLMKAIDRLKQAGYVYELSDLDAKQLPLVMQEAPDDFFPVLIMPAEVRKRCLEKINANDLDSLYQKTLCRQ